MAGAAPSLQRVWLSVSEAEQVTGISRKELYEALQSGDLPGTQRVRNGKWRVHVDSLNSWMRRYEQAAS